MLLNLVQISLLQWGAEFQAIIAAGLAAAVSSSPRPFDALAPSPHLGCHPRRGSALALAVAVVLAFAVVLVFAVVFVFAVILSAAKDPGTASVTHTAGTFPPGNLAPLSF
jgi:hypothetical protein